MLTDDERARLDAIDAVQARIDDVRELRRRLDEAMAARDAAILAAHDAAGWSVRELAELAELPSSTVQRSITAALHR